MKIILIVVSMVYYPHTISYAFSRATYHTRRQLIMAPHKNSILFSTLERQHAMDEDTNTNQERRNSDSINPLGPPDSISSLCVGESIHSYGKNVTRISTSPDIFLIKDLISSEDRKTLIQAAQHQGMNVAGTRSSGKNTVRKNSYLTWIDPYSIESSNGASASVARDIISKSLCFTHDVMKNLINNVEKMDFCFAEDLQVAKYDKGGRFDYHHDGFSRYLTVLSYLNGVGGTYFPYGNMSDELVERNFTISEDGVSVMSFKKQFERCGVLIAGKEGSDPYLKSSYVNPKSTVYIKEGDAVAFYSFTEGGEKDLRQLHCSLPVPEEKWIATCWFRSDALTGPFAYLKKAQLLEEL